MIDIDAPQPTLGGALVDVNLALDDHRQFIGVSHLGGLTPPGRAPHEGHRHVIIARARPAEDSAICFGGEPWAANTIREADGRS
jgi:hypothetical protein